LTAQRNSGYPREARDLYKTPASVMETLLDVVYVAGPVWDPAAVVAKEVLRVGTA
jgi:hypothetical protein